MKGYIETDTKVIEAIHQCIEDKWNPICMGSGTEVYCSLCDMFPKKNCKGCPLDKADNNCNRESSSWYKYNEINTRCGICEKVLGKEHCKSSVVDCPEFSENEMKLYSAAGAEAMLEALVMLLPEKERERYGS